MKRLAPATLADLPCDVPIPGYDRAQPAGVFHLGVGAFHRAHQAAFFDALLGLGERGWMIEGASLRSDAAARALNPQEGLYVLVERSGEARRARVIGALRQVWPAPRNPRAVVERMAQPHIALVTLTVTEKGYCLDPSAGTLNVADPLVAADIADLAHPRTAPGFLVAALAARCAQGIAPFTVLSCDNLADNGRRTRAAVLELASRVDPSLARWIEREVAFPSSMVDRIVPRTPRAEFAAFGRRTGLIDEALVATETFSQWVIEDRFCNRRPPLERAGVEWVTDVRAHERAKLRFLNAAHSAMAYLGGLAGHVHVHEAFAAPGFAGFIEALWDEAAAMPGFSTELDLADYRTRLARRFADPALGHELSQIAIDGSQKLPQRWIATIRAHRCAGRPPPPALTLALAGWARWLRGVDDRSAQHEICDPLAPKLAAVVAAAGGDDAALARGLLSLRAIFGDLAEDDDLARCLARDCARLARESAAEVVAHFRATSTKEAG